MTNKIIKQFNDLLNDLCEFKKNKNEIECVEKITDGFPYFIYQNARKELIKIISEYKINGITPPGPLVNSITETPTPQQSPQENKHVPPPRPPRPEAPPRPPPPNYEALQGNKGGSRNTKKIKRKRYHSKKGRRNNSRKRK